MTTSGLTIFPNIADDSDLSVWAFRLYCHYLRVSGYGGTFQESVRTTAKRCGMSPAKVIQARRELEAGGWIETYTEDGGQAVVIDILDKSAENAAAYD